MRRIFRSNAAQRSTLKTALQTVRDLRRPFLDNPDAPKNDVYLRAGKVLSPLRKLLETLERVK